MPNEARRPTSGDPLPSRRARRAASRQATSRRDPRLDAAKTAAPPPAWRSPFMLMTIAAIVIGLGVIVMASGGLGGSSLGAIVDPPADRLTPTNLVDPANARALGPADAKIQIVVWSDFQCPACGILAREVEPALVSEYVATGKAHLTYRDFAFLDNQSRAKESQNAAAAARCATAQGKFWPFHDYLFWNQHGENEGAFTDDRLRTIAEKAGLDLATYDACYATRPLADVAAESGEAVKAGATLTPTLQINGTLYPGAYPMGDMRTILDKILAGPTPAPSGSPAPSAGGSPAASATPAP